jgi:hypothetical protein
MEDAEQTADQAIGFGLPILLGSEFAGARLGSQSVHAVLVSRAERQGEKALGSRWRQAGYVNSDQAA